MILQGALAVAILTAVVASAQIPAGAPKGSTARCKDGTFYQGTRRQDACRNNGGVQEWWGKLVAPADVPGAGSREAYDKAVHPAPVVPPAGGSEKK
jgi:hypothetical protein